MKIRFIGLLLLISCQKIFASADSIQTGSLAVKFSAGFSFPNVFTTFVLPNHYEIGAGAIFFRSAELTVSAEKNSYLDVTPKNCNNGYTSANTNTFSISLIMDIPFTPFFVGAGINRVAFGVDSVGCPRNGPFKDSFTGYRICLGVRLNDWFIDFSGQKSFTNTDFRRLEFVADRYYVLQLGYRLQLFSF